MQRDVWEVFHDGTVVRIEGAVPGDLRIGLEITYLRRMFDEPGDSFTVELGSCSRFQYTEYDAERTENLPDIESKEPEILSVESVEPLVICCVMGTLELEYKSMKVLLPSGTEVDERALLSAGQRYWDEWSAGGNRET